MLPFHTILHPTDFSEQADRAFRLARLIARECGARLIVLHVAGMHADVPHVVHNEIGIVFEPSGDYQSHHAALKEKLQERFETDPAVPVETRLIYGAAAYEIIHLAEQEKCDLIVLGTHGRSGLGRLVMGSTAEAVLRQSPCPVLTVKDPVFIPGSSQGGPEPAATLALPEKIGAASP
jgi:nucleotide-binding universal stress UspA family protein